MSQQNTFSLADLIPEPLYFRDVVDCATCSGQGDVNGQPCVVCSARGKVQGERYEARPASAFGPVEYARYRRVYDEFRRTWAIVGGNASGEAVDRETAAAEMVSAADEMLAVIVPDLPRERVRALPFGYKFRFIDWWRKQQPQEQQSGEAGAGQQQQTPARRSRGSSTRGMTRSR